MDAKQYLSKLPYWFRGAVYGLIVVTVLNFLTDTFYGIHFLNTTQMLVTGLFFGAFLGLTYELIGAFMSKGLSGDVITKEYARTTLAILAFTMILLNSYVANVVPLDFVFPFQSTGEAYRIGVTVFVYDSQGNQVPFTLGIRDSSNNQLLRQDFQIPGPETIQVNTDLSVHRAYVNCIGQNYQVGKNVQFTPIPGFGINACFGKSMSSCSVIGPALDCAASQCAADDIGCKHFVKSCSGTNLVWKDPQGFVTEVIESCASLGSCYEGDTRTTAHCQQYTSACPAGSHQDATGKCVQDTTVTTNPYPRTPTTTIYNPYVTEPTNPSPPTTQATLPRQCSTGAIDHRFENCYNAQLSYSTRVCNSAGQWGSWETTSMDCKTLGKDYCSSSAYTSSNPTAACLKSTTQSTQPSQTTPTTSSTTTTLPQTQQSNDMFMAFGLLILIALFTLALLVLVILYRRGTFNSLLNRQPQKR